MIWNVLKTVISYTWTRAEKHTTHTVQTLLHLPSLFRVGGQVSPQAKGQTLLHACQRSEACRASGISRLEWLNGACGLLLNTIPNYLLRNILTLCGSKYLYVIEIISYLWGRAFDPHIPYVRYLFQAASHLTSSDQLRCLISAKCGYKTASCFHYMVIICWWRFYGMFSGWKWLKQGLERQMTLFKQESSVLCWKKCMTFKLRCKVHFCVWQKLWFR